MNFNDKLHNFIDSTARRIPSPLLRIFSMPLSYQMNSKDSLIYESARMVNTAFAFCMNNKVGGDYAEFGVYQGRTCIESYRSAQRYGFSQMKFWAFDSFAGLPDIDGKDVGGPFVEGEFSCARPNFERNLRNQGVNLDKFKIVEGFYDQTLKTVADLKKVAIVYIDCDLYESTVPVLNFLTDKLAHGAILIFDDWFCFDGGEMKGEQLACAEWLERNPNIKLVEYQKFHWAGISFIVNRKD